MNLNVVVLGGNLVRDPETKALPNNRSVCNFTLAINKTWTDNAGAKKERVSFIDCAAFGATGEVVAQYVAKGDALTVEGEIQQENWQGPAGEKRSKLGIVVSRVHLLRSKGNQNNAHNDNRDNSQREKSPAKSSGGGAHAGGRGRHGVGPSR